MNSKINVNNQLSIERHVQQWIEKFNAAIEKQNVTELGDIFIDDCHWRDLLALTWRIETHSGRESLQEKIIVSAKIHGMKNFQLDKRRSAPKLVERAGQSCIEAFGCFDTNIGKCISVFRLSTDGNSAWTFMSALEEVFDSKKDKKDDIPDVGTDISAPNWLDLRIATKNFSNRDPKVLIVGGGHAGCTSAAELGRLGVDALVVDKEKRIGDNWRLRYHSLKLHNRTPINHFPHMPFPDTFPGYIPKDKLANWIETYVDAMEINFWTETKFKGAKYDTVSGHWLAELTLNDGSIRTLKPKHIIMATSVSGTPNIPRIPTLDKFLGKVIHSSKYKNGKEWQDKETLVIGTGTSAHDICQNLYANGAKVTMIQRSPTMVVNVDPSAQLYDGLYLQADGKTKSEGTLLELDQINSSFPMAVTRRAHQIITRKVKEIDAPLLNALEEAGFRLEFGEDNTGWPLKYRQRGGGYYFNAGCSDLIAACEIDLLQYDDIKTFKEDGLLNKNGDNLTAQLIVLATGYKGQDYLTKQLFGEKVATKVGKVWGVNPDTQELNNMWSSTGQEGLWYTAGSLSQCRIYSKYLAMQIKALEMGYKFNKSY
ncbi:NAD(P)/FAD-dependent oxidoreductase [Alphaproteobacteria bacterium]|nr:NAD(P)/FAD-dependent oxidoreductase [Alphaproteobacteria bacterium]MDB9870128.1 NAD(P)/FAD-dependent oxidoreductase [Alphaproteobacteria bacterium]MDC0134691.1 NAD(P)/FAD-dependent oxidoreductase [Alphaproteobacteria bacterium]